MKRTARLSRNTCWWSFSVAVALYGLVSTSPGPARASLEIGQARVIDDAALADEQQGSNWLAFGRTYSEQRFSPLTQINNSNVSHLAVESQGADSAPGIT